VLSLARPVISLGSFYFRGTLYLPDRLCRYRTFTGLFTGLFTGFLLNLQDFLLTLPDCLPWGYEEGNLVFVARVVGNSMRNGHASFAQCAEAFGMLDAGRALVRGDGREQICAPR
jgi:hypothetical protein